MMFVKYMYIPPANILHPDLYEFKEELVRCFINDSVSLKLWQTWQSKESQKKKKKFKHIHYEPPRVFECDFSCFYLLFCARELSEKQHGWRHRGHKERLAWNNLRGTHKSCPEKVDLKNTKHAWKERSAAQASLCACMNLLCHSPKNKHREAEQHLSSLAKK